MFARSFARIAETNLKKQGVLALTFRDPSVYDAIGEDDTVDILGLRTLAPDVDVSCRLVRSDGSSMGFAVTHTLDAEQIAWFRAGSALNIIRNQVPEPRA